VKNIDVFGVYVDSSPAGASVSPASASVSLVNINKIDKVSKFVILKFALTTPRIYKTLEATLKKHRNKNPKTP